MGSGVIVRNDSLETQIDADYTNYSLHEHGESVSTSDMGDGLGIRKAVVSFSSATPYYPLIAIKPGSNYCGFGYHTKSGSNYTGFVVYSLESTTTTFDWQAFSANQVKSGEDYGLRVYSSSGVLTFDSGHISMKCLDFLIATPDWNTVGDVSHESDANGYFIVSSFGMKEARSSLGGGTVELVRSMAMMKYVNATTISFGGRYMLYATPPGSAHAPKGYWPSSWNILMVGKAF